MRVNRIRSWYYQPGCHLGGGALCGELGGRERRWGSGYLASGEGILRALGLVQEKPTPPEGSRSGLNQEQNLLFEFG